MPVATPVRVPGRWRLAVERRRDAVPGALRRAALRGRAVTGRPEVVGRLDPSAWGVIACWSGHGTICLIMSQYITHRFRKTDTPTWPGYGHQNSLGSLRDYGNSTDSFRLYLLAYCIGKLKYFVFRCSMESSVALEFEMVTYPGYTAQYIHKCVYTYSVHLRSK